MAFFNTPGMEWLYSGVTTMTPSAFRNRLGRAGYDRREAFFLQFIIVERKLADRRERLDRYPFRRERGQSAGDRRVEGALAQAAHHDGKMQRLLLRHRSSPLDKSFAPDAAHG